MDRPFVVENARALERLRNLVKQITDDELGYFLWEGWTVAAALAHLAFWDQRALVLMKKWKISGVAASPIDDDVTNDSILPFCSAIPSRAGANLALSCAEKIDWELENAPDDLINDVKKLGEKFRLYRCAHRKEHLDQIEKVLKMKKR